MRRRAFTLIEMVVVCAVLGMVAAVVLPNVVGMKANRDREEAYRAILRLAQVGHETAIQSGHPYVLSLNGAQVSLDRAEETELSREGQSSSEMEDSPDRSTTTVRLPQSVVGSSPAATSSSSSAAGGSAADGARVNLPEGASLGDVILDGKASTTSDFLLHFYPDGRSEGGGFEITAGASTRSLQVDRNGLATMQDGQLPPTAENSWEAGQYEQRAAD